MNYIKGKIRNIIYHNKDNGYVVAVFALKKPAMLKWKNMLEKQLRLPGLF